MYTLICIFIFYFVFGGRVGMCLLFVMVNGFFKPSLNETSMEFPSKVNINNLEKQEGEQVKTKNSLHYCSADIKSK